MKSKSVQVVDLCKKDRVHDPREYMLPPQHQVTTLTLKHREDTPEAFRDFPTFSNASHNARLPDGYDLTVEGVGGSIDMGLGYLGSQLLGEYDTEVCASFCNDLPTCSSFNIYFERSPVLDPSVKDGCPNPESTTLIKCVLWRTELTKDSAVNVGETRAEFQVVIAGSNLYNKQAGVPVVPDFNGPNDVDNGAAFDVPLEPMGGFNTHLSHEIFPFESARQLWRLKSNSTSADGSTRQNFTQGYDVSLCADTCGRWTDGNLEPPQDTNPYFDGAFPVCSMFVAYELRSNGSSMAMACDTFSSVWSSHYQTRREFDGMEVFKVSVYTREDYQYPAICAEKKRCKGGEYYAGGDCSGWGSEKCHNMAKEPQDEGEDGQSKEKSQSKGGEV